MAMECLVAGEEIFCSRELDLGGNVGTFVDFIALVCWCTDVDFGR